MDILGQQCLYNASPAKAPPRKNGALAHCNWLYIMYLNKYDDDDYKGGDEDENKYTNEESIGILEYTLVFECTSATVLVHNTPR